MSLIVFYCRMHPGDFITLFFSFDSSISIVELQMMLIFVSVQRLIDLSCLAVSSRSNIDEMMRCVPADIVNLIVKYVAAQNSHLATSKFQFTRMLSCHHISIFLVY